MTASKLVALFPRTEAPWPKDRDGPRLAASLLSQPGPRSADDQAALAGLNRLSLMGEMAASLAQDIITQPIATARNNAIAAIRFLDGDSPDLGEVREALECIVADVSRAEAIFDRIDDLIKRAPARTGRFDLNEAINEVIVLARTAIAENGVSVQTRLTEGLVPVEGDRVQLQQV